MELKDLQKIDRGRMYEYYDRWPDIAKQSYEKEFVIPEFSDVDHIVFAGMGGSGSIGDVISSILSKKNIHVSVIKGYTLPKTVDRNTVIVITSISGNTDETISILRDSMKSNAKVLVFSSGGKLEDICKSNNIEHFKIEKDHSPRVSLLVFLYSILKIMKEILPINEDEIIESLKKLKELQRSICSSNLNEENSALRLAEWITDIPVIYYPLGLKASAIRFKNSLQENAKMHVIVEDVIEACHNGIVSWSMDKKLKPIFIQGIDDHIKTKERWTILQDFFNEENIEYMKIASVSGGILSKLVCLSYELDYVSLYKAVLNNIDPGPVLPIDFIKSKLRD